MTNEPRGHHEHHHEPHNIANRISTDILKFTVYNRIVDSEEAAYEVMKKKHLVAGEPCCVKYYVDKEDGKHTVDMMFCIGAGVDEKGRELPPVKMTSEKTIIIDGKEYSYSEAIEYILDLIEHSSLDVEPIPSDKLAQIINEHLK